MTTWNVNFLQSEIVVDNPLALIILNQPFSTALLRRLWDSCQWRCCADGGANRLYDAFLQDSSLNPQAVAQARVRYLPELIKGDLDSIRPDVRDFYRSHDVPIVQDDDQNSTDLMKCVSAIKEKEKAEGSEQYDIVLLGGLSGRLDQTVHTLSYLHKLRKSRQRVYAVTDDNVGWVLDSGEHSIEIDHTIMGQTCGLLPVGIDETILSTRGLKWNLTDHPSSFDGLVSTSNHLVPHQDVWIKTSKAIWWTVELKTLAL